MVADDFGNPSQKTRCCTMLKSVLSFVLKYILAPIPTLLYGVIFGGFPLYLAHFFGWKVTLCVSLFLVLILLLIIEQLPVLSRWLPSVYRNKWSDKIQSFRLPVYFCLFMLYSIVVVFGIFDLFHIRPYFGFPDAFGVERSSNLFAISHVLWEIFGVTIVPFTIIVAAYVSAMMVGLILEILNALFRYEISEDWKRNNRGLTSKDGVSLYLQTPNCWWGSPKTQAINIGSNERNHVLIQGGSFTENEQILTQLAESLNYMYAGEISVYRLDFSELDECSDFADVEEKINSAISSRSELFRQAGVSRYSEYRAVTGLPLERLIILVDGLLSSLDQRRQFDQFTTFTSNILELGGEHGIHLIAAFYDLPKDIIPDAMISKFTTRISLRVEQQEFDRLALQWSYEDLHNKINSRECAVVQCTTDNSIRLVSIP